ISQAVFERHREEMAQLNQQRVLLGSVDVLDSSERQAHEQEWLELAPRFEKLATEREQARQGLAWYEQLAQADEELSTAQQALSAVQQAQHDEQANARALEQHRVATALQSTFQHYKETDNALATLKQEQHTLLQLALQQSE